jgi:hypothetical protein
MPLLSLLAFCLLCWLSRAAAAGAADVSPPPTAIWSGLVLATNDPHPAQAPARLRQLADKLKNIFGYNQFELVGEYSEKMDDPYERWLIPSKDFCLSVKTHNEPGAHFPTKIVLFQNRRRLAEFETKLNSQSPLFIRGPLYAGGQLVIVVRVVDPSEVPIHSIRTPFVAVNPGPVVSGATPPKEKPIPTALATIPKDRFGPMPADRFVPTPADRFGPIPADHLGPLPGERGGDMDSKFGRP